MASRNFGLLAAVLAVLVVLGHANASRHRDLLNASEELKTTTIASARKSSSESSKSSSSSVSPIYSEILTAILNQPVLFSGSGSCGIALAAPGDVEAAAGCSSALFCPGGSVCTTSSCSQGCKAHCALYGKLASQAVQCPAATPSPPPGQDDDDGTDDDGDSSDGDDDGTDVVDDDDGGDDDVYQKSPSTCAALQKGSSWPTSGQSGSATVCAASSWKNQKFSQSATFSVAKTACSKIGARLCTQKQIASGELSGLSSTDFSAWTQTVCTAGGKSGYMIIKSKSGTGAVCVTDLTKFKNAGVFCCADS